MSRHSQAGRSPHEFEVNPMRNFLVLIVLSTLAVSLSSACGDAPPEPELSGLRVDCAASSDPDVDGEVVEEVSVKVTDPNRDLIGVSGTINGVAITLGDDDADQRFSWSPPDNGQPMVCSGQLEVSVTAVDQAGHQASTFRIVEK